MLNWFLPDDAIFSKVALHGNTKWVPRSLVWLALLWAISPCKNLTDAFEDSLECFRKLSNSYVPSTYQGLMGQLAQWTSTFIGLLCIVLQERMEEIGGKYWRYGGWVPIAFDGSRSTCPRTKANEAALCAKNFGRGKTAKYRKKKSKGMRRKKNERNKPAPQTPQAWITLMWHMGLRLPWTWRLGPTDSSERTHVMEMLRAGKFPKKTLFCGDAGFVGYEFWKQILTCKQHFLVRVGANVSLLSESADYKILDNGFVLCWPKTMMQSDQPPLRLRLVRVHIGKTKVNILTSVLDSSKLTPQQIIKLYKMRWGIEVEFRGLKQTLDRARLRCRNNQRLLAELDWSIMAMAVTELFALKEQLDVRTLKSKRDQSKSIPSKRSLASAIRALRRCMRQLDDVPEPGEDLQSQLRAAVTDSYTRKTSKKSRYRPPNPDKKPLGDPKIRRLTRDEKMKLRNHPHKLAA